MKEFIQFFLKIDLFLILIDFDENYFELLIELRHMSLFSICLHFLRCVSSCDKKPNYCKLCSSVCENFFVESNAFLCLTVCAYGTYMFLENVCTIDLNVFLFGDTRYLKQTKNCSLFQVFKYPQELFAAFSSLLVRMYLHCTFRSLSKLFCSISLVDEKKEITEIIVKHCRIFLDKFWHANNYQFFVDFFLIDLIRLIQVFVLIILLVNFNLVHIILEIIHKL